jgi:hypothetical protein
MEASRFLLKQICRPTYVELWNTAASEDGEAGVEDALLELIGQRLLAHAANPAAVSTWDEVNQRVFGSHGPRDSD